MFVTQLEADLSQPLEAQQGTDPSLSLILAPLLMPVSKYVPKMRLHSLDHFLKDKLSWIRNAVPPQGVSTQQLLKPWSARGTAVSEHLEQFLGIKGAEFSV